MGVMDRIRERICLVGELNNAIAKKARGCPGWESTIARLQSRLFGSSTSSPAKQAPVAIHRNPTAVLANQHPYFDYPVSVGAGSEFKLHGQQGSGDVEYSSGPAGSFDFARDREDRKRSQQDGLNQILVQQIDVTATGIATGFNPFFCDHNGLQILARTMDDNGNVTESSDTARVFIKFNRPNSPWVPLGFSFSNQGVQKSDNLVFQGYIEKFWVYVQQATQDPANQPKLVIALLRSVALYGPGGGSNLYGSPSTSGPSPSETSVSVSEGGGGPGAPGGGQQGGGGGGVGGGGGGGGKSTL